MVPLVLIAVNTITYANSRGGPFIIDDVASVVENPYIRQIWPLTDAMASERESPLAGRPLVSLSFALNYAIGELSVAGYHFVNIALHLSNALLLFGIVRRTLESDRLRFGADAVPIAFATALLWLVHPLNSEAVNYVTQRTELMMALFYLLTFYGAIAALDSPHARLWSAVAVGACGFGMLCKESMVTAPLMVWLYDRQFGRSRWRLYAALTGTWIVLASVLWSGPRIHSAGWSTNVSTWTYLLNQAVMIVRYLRLTVWPSDLVVGYGFPRPLTLADVWPAALIVAGGLGATLALLRKAPRLGFLGAWFFVTLAPTSSVVPIATEVGAERRMYLPLMALLLFGVLALWRRVPSASARLATVISLASICVLVTIARNREFQSALTLAQTVLERWPSGYAHLFLATELIAKGDHRNAVSHLRDAVREAPRAHYLLARELILSKQWDAAFEHLQAFVRLEPLLLEVLPARFEMGRILMRRGQLDAAIEQFQLVLRMNSSFVDAHLQLGDALIARQQFDPAIEEYRRYLTARPRDASALTNLAVAYQHIGRTEEAVAVLRQALEVDPAHRLAARNLALVLLARNDYSGAVTFARQAVALESDDPIAHDLLGVGLAYLSKFDDALAELQRALKLDPTNAEIQEHFAAVKRQATVRH